MATTKIPKEMTKCSVCSSMHFMTNPKPLKKNKITNSMNSLMFKIRLIQEVEYNSLFDIITVVGGVQPI